MKVLIKCNFSSFFFFFFQNCGYKILPSSEMAWILVGVTVLSTGILFIDLVLGERIAGLDRQIMLRILVRESRWFKTEG